MFSYGKGLSGNQANSASKSRLVPSYKQFVCQL